MYCKLKQNTNQLRILYKFNSIQCPYKVLDIPITSDSKEIRKAFLTKAKLCHPDKAEDRVQAEKDFKELMQAYETLKDDQKRAQYDFNQNKVKHKPGTYTSQSYNNFYGQRQPGQDQQYSNEQYSSQFSQSGGFYKQNSQYQYNKDAYQEFYENLQREEMDSNQQQQKYSTQNNYEHQKSDFFGFKLIAVSFTILFLYFQLSSEDKFKDEYVKYRFNPQRNNYAEPSLKKMQMINEEIKRKKFSIVVENIESKSKPKKGSLDHFLQTEEITQNDI